MQNIIKLHYFIASIMVSLAEISYTHDHLTKAIEYVQDYNGWHLKDVVILASSMYFDNNEAFLHEVEHNDVISNLQVAFMTTSGNLSRVLQTTNKLILPSIVVLLDFETSECTQKAFFDSGVQPKDKIWLLWFSTNFSSTHSFNIAINKLIARYYKYLSRLSLNTHVHAISQINGIFHLYDVYYTCDTTKVFTKHLTNLSDENLNQYSNHIWENRKDFGQCPIRVGYLDYGSLLWNVKDNQTKAHEASMISLEPKSSPTLRAGGLLMQGIKVQLFSVLYSKLNFSIKWVRVEDNKFGAFDSVLNDWNGIVGMIKRNEIDTSTISITNARSNVVAYSIPIQRYSNRLFIRKPGPSVSWTTFINVFDFVYWYVILAFMTVFIVLLITVSYHSKEEKIQSKIVNARNAVSTTVLAFVAFDVPGASDWNSREYNSRRILLLAICLCGAINFYAYNAGLISYLIAEHHEHPINDLTDILEHPSYKLLVAGGTSDEDFLRYSQDPKLRQIWNKTTKEKGMISSDEEAIQQLRKDDKKVYLGFSPYFEMLLEKEQCNISGLRVRFNSHYGGYVFNKESQFLDIFNYHIQGMMDTEALSKVLDEMKESIKCENHKQSHFKEIDYMDVCSAFGILGLGCALSLGYSILEVVFNVILKEGEGNEEGPSKKNEPPSCQYVTTSLESKRINIREEFPNTSSHIKIKP